MTLHAYIALQLGSPGISRYRITREVPTGRCFVTVIVDASPDKVIEGITQGTILTWILEFSSILL